MRRSEGSHPGGRASSRAACRVRAVPCEVQARPISGGRGSGERRMLRLASRGFGNRQIAFTPCRFAVHALSLRPLPCFRKSAALSRVMVATARIVRSYRRRRSRAFRRPRLAGVCGAASARCCRLAPLRPRIRLAIRARRRRERLASPRVRSLPPLHDSITHYQRTVGGSRGRSPSRPFRPFCPLRPLRN